jgi:hypothetical protein
VPPRGQRLRDEPLVRTSVRFPRDLLKRARIRVATDECSFQSLLIAALETELAKRDRAEAARSRRASKHA